MSDFAPSNQRHHPHDNAGSRRIYIIGAGFSGSTIAREITHKGVLGSVVAFLDDDPAKIGSQIDDIPVLGPIRDVARLLRPQPQDHALIAMPSASRERLREIYAILSACQFGRIRILPAVNQILEGDAHLIQTRELDPQDLLSRPPVTIGLRQSLNYLRGKRVLITGAGGSIGSELARQLLLGGAERLYILGHGENSVYEIDKELRMLQEEGVGEHATIVPILGELQDPDYLDFLLPRLHADVIFHCAAYKHVPMGETNPVMTVKNNVFGTWFLLNAAQKAGVKRFVLISTDKVVSPASIYGATKKICESLVLNRFPEDPEQKFMVVRFGNVLGSRGSIVPLFKSQIMKGGPVTVTHPETSRYFMTIPEAASLVLKAGGVGDNGHLYLLDMGEPLLIRELAETMIRFYGHEPNEDIHIEYVGLREGEKIHENLHEGFERVAATPYARIQEVSGMLDWLGGAPSGGDRDSPAARALDQLLAELRPVCFREASQETAYRNRRVLRETLRRYFQSIPEKEHEPEY
jgi:FlaA1/EpsC-like NDP-sugar epimerase